MIAIDGEQSLYGRSRPFAGDGCAVRGYVVQEFVTKRPRRRKERPAPLSPGGRDRIVERLRVVRAAVPLGTPGFDVENRLLFGTSTLCPDQQRL